MLTELGDCLRRVRRVSNECHVRLAFDHRSQAVTNDGVIVDAHDSNWIAWADHRCRLMPEISLLAHAANSNSEPLWLDPVHLINLCLPRVMASYPNPWASDHRIWCGANHEITSFLRHADEPQRGFIRWAFRLHHRLERF
jgi:hypothetical protein